MGEEQAKTRRLIFCFDGTWNRLSVPTPTNVVKMAQMIMPIAPDGTAQIVYYDEGIGTQSDFRRYIAGALGSGMEAIMREAYRFLIFNYRPGDQIYAFGFSRGAYTARSFLGFIRHAGILDAAYANQIDEAIRLYRQAPAGQIGEESVEAIAFRFRNCTGCCVSDKDRAARIELYGQLSEEARAECPTDPADVAMLDIRFLGVWDTVRARGLPFFLPFARQFNAKYAFHNAVLTSKVAAARHAVAIDEPRLTFRPTLFGKGKVAELNALAERKRGKPVPPWKQPYQEQWFPGVHGAVGGGGIFRGLSDIPLAWILRGARDCGLVVRTDGSGPIYSLERKELGELYNHESRSFYQRGIIGWLLGLLLHRPRAGPAELADLHLVTLQRWFAAPDKLPGGQPYRPRTLAGLASTIGEWQWRPGWLAEPAGGGTWREHVIVGKDTLGTIAELYLGDRKRWREIFDLNRDRIEDPDDLANGMLLRVPPEGAAPPPAPPLEEDPE